MTQRPASNAVRLLIAAGIVVGGGALVVTSMDTASDTSVPASTRATSPDPQASATPTDDGHHHGGHDGADAHPVVGAGLSSSTAGYTLSVEPVTDDQLTFRILDDSGQPVTDYTEQHTKQLHMFVFRPDLTGFRHVHPILDDSGVWSLPVDLMPTGRHRVVTEFDVADDEEPSVMLGAWATNGTQPSGQRLPDPVRIVAVDAGYTVLVEGDVFADPTSGLHVSMVDRRGVPAPLRPYLGSWAHAVLIHSGTLAVTHLHPDVPYVPGDAAPSDLHLGTSVNHAGRYRLIIELATDAGVHQAEFTVDSPQ